MNWITQQLGVLAVLFFCSFSYSDAQTINSGTSGITAPTGTTTIHNMWDDGHVHIPLQFGFPYFGKLFTNSIMYDNGVVGFFAPATETTQQIGCDPTVNGYCGGNNWGSQQFTTTLGPSWNYMIAPLHTDMRPVASSVYSTTGDATQMTYRWQDIGEYYNPSNLNTFSLQIKPSGFIGVDYEKVNIGQSNVSVGLAGDLSKGEFAQHYWAPAGTPIISSSISNWNVTGTGADPCVSNPLVSTSCSGYAEAYFNQQCSYSALYNINCPGYAAAYLTYQCSLSSLYSSSCPGYADAYYLQQCTADPLYDKGCTGYADAYYVQQCTADPLYDKGCTGYAEAYAMKNILNIGSTTTKPAPETVAVTVSVTEPDKVQIIADPVVNDTITATATSANPAQAATATVPLVTTSSTSTDVTTAVVVKEEKKEEKKTETTSSSISTTTASASTDNKNEPKTTKQALAERRLEAARAKAVEQGKNLAGKMGEAATMEAQVAVQNVVIAAMGFTPGFDAYSKVALQDAAGYKPFEIYKGQRNIDNPAGRRFMTGSDRLHSEMVDGQYHKLQ